MATVLMIAVPLTLFLAACRPDADGPASAHAAAPAPAAGAATADTTGNTPAVVDSQWQCGDQHVAARFDNRRGELTLTHARGQLLLPQASSASGARYADANGNVFWDEGPNASLTLSGTAERACQRLQASNAP